MVKRRNNEDALWNKLKFNWNEIEKDLRFFFFNPFAGENL